MILINVEVQLDLSLLVKLSYELGSIITRYDFIEARQMILSNIDLILHAINFS